MLAAGRHRIVFPVVTAAALMLAPAASAALTWSGPIPLDHHGATVLNAVACPASTQCTAVDAVGQQVTFLPSSPAGAATSTISPGAEPAAIACASVHQCTQVDGSGDETTFDPTAPGDPTPAVIDSGHALFGVACPSATLCVAVDDAQRETCQSPVASAGRGDISMWWMLMWPMSAADGALARFAWWRGSGRRVVAILRRGCSPGA